MTKATVSSPHRSNGLPVARADVAAKPEIVVALYAEHEQLVEWCGAEGMAGAELLRKFVAIILSLREPVRHRGALQFFKEARVAGPETRCFRTGARGELKAVFGNVDERAADGGCLLQLEAGRGQAGRQRRAVIYIAKDAVGELGSKRPCESSAVKRCDGATDGFAFQFE